MVWLAVPIALVLGVMAGHAGSWVRLHQVESRLRAIAVACRVHADMGDPLDHEWVAAQIDWAVAEDFR